MIALGVNDILRGTTISQWTKDTMRLVDHLLHTVGVGHVYVSGLPAVSQFPCLRGPLRWTLGHQAARYDRALRASVAGRSEAMHIPADMHLGPDVMAQDGFHPGPKVYATWADMIVVRITADRNL